MCGVAGVLGGELSPHERRAVLGRMLGAFPYRGPDAWGTYVGREAGLGHVRLSIVDLSAGHQPFCLDGHVLSFNGEIFNHPELRQELEALGVQFRTHSDTEVLLRALIAWGPEALSRLNGQFAFLYYHEGSAALLAARDRFGIRPLYFARHEGAVYFSSEPKGFDQVPGLGRRIDPHGLLAHGLLWNTLGRRTVYSGIESLEAGTWALFGQGQLRQTFRYHELGGAGPVDLPKDFEEAKEGLRTRLKRSVSLQLRSDVPVGNYLSGGIDSSIITLLTDQLRSDEFQTFSIAFQDEAFDESAFQQLMGERIRNVPCTVRISAQDIESHFELAVRHADCPLFRTAPIPLFQLARKVRETGIRVVLTGEAADEILWGYDSYKELKLLRFWSKFPESKLRPQLLRVLYPHLAHYRESKNFGLMRMFYEGFLGSYDNELLGLNLRVHNNAILEKYLRPELISDLPETWLMEQLTETQPVGWDGWSMLQRNQHLEMRTLLQGYLLASQADRMSLAHGIEGRYPFLDHELVDWVFHLPDRFKLPLLSQKHLLREAYRDELPAEIVDRPKQPYQAPDLKAFLHEGVFSPVVRDFLSDAAVADAGIFEPKMVQRLLMKLERRAGEHAGYRDNMLICFLLSTQMIASHIKNPAVAHEPTSPRPVDLIRGTESR